jgi:hypothetical protein
VVPARVQVALEVSVATVDPSAAKAVKVNFTVLPPGEQLE